MAAAKYNVQAYLFNDYWEDIGTIKSFFDANLSLVDQVLDSIISHGCVLRECSIEHSVVGVRSRLEYGAELKDTMMMGADYYQTEAERISLLAEGKVPVGVGRNTKIRNCIIDKNAKIGKDVVIANKDVRRSSQTPLPDLAMCESSMDWVSPKDSCVVLLKDMPHSLCVETVFVPAAILRNSRPLQIVISLNLEHPHRKCCLFIQNVAEAERPSEGFYIRSGITRDAPVNSNGAGSRQNVKGVELCGGSTQAVAHGEP
ncbi:beta-adaptin [Asimina triloba]